MSDRDIPQEDVIDADDNDPRTVVTRLTRVHDLLFRVNARLTDITNRWIGPGPPEQPATLGELNAIGSEAMRAKQMADVLILRITGAETGGGAAPAGGGGTPTGDRPLVGTPTGGSKKGGDEHDHDKGEHDHDKGEHKDNEKDEHKDEKSP